MGPCTRSQSRASTISTTHSENGSENISPSSSSDTHQQPESSSAGRRISETENSLLYPESISLDSSADAEHFIGSPNAADSSSGIGSPTSSLPESDLSFHRKFFIMQANSNTGEIHSLPHPRSGNAVLYLLDQCANPFELMRLDQHAKQSVFYGDSVIADPGPFIMFLPVHPLFLALPFLQAKASQSFHSADDFLHSEEFPALKLLGQSEKLIETLRLVADCEENGDIQLYRFNSDRLLEWLKLKFQVLKDSIQAKMGDTQPGGVSLEHQALGILVDYLSESNGQSLREHLGIIEEDKETAELKPQIGGSNSRKRIATVDPFTGLATTPKTMPTKREKKISRVLAAASKGTQSLKSFFIVDQKKGEEKKEEIEEQRSNKEEE